MFSYEYCEMFRYSFLYRTPPVHYDFQKFYVMIELLWCLLVQNWYFSYFLCHYFGFLRNSCGRIGKPSLFRICLVFIPKFKGNFSTYYNDGCFTILIESLKFRTNSRIIAAYPSNLLWKMWIWVFWILCYVIIFL